MANMQKYSSSSIGGILRHDERTEGDKVIARKNETIDPTRTHLNYRFTHTSHKTEPIQYIKDFTEENNINLNKRKDLKAMVSWVVTMPTAENGISSAEQERFFFETNRFLCDRYGFLDKNGNVGNVLSSVVHLDETTPHLHFCFIPVAYDCKNHRYTVSAKLVCSRKDLQTFHKDLTEHMRLVFGRDIGIETGKTKEFGNKSISELKEFTKQECLNSMHEASECYNSLSAEAEAVLRRSNAEADEIIREATERAAELVSSAERKAIKFINTPDFKIKDEWIMSKKVGKLFDKTTEDFVQAPASYINRMCSVANKHIDHTSELDELREKLEEDKVRELEQLRTEHHQELVGLNSEIEQLRLQCSEQSATIFDLSSENKILKAQLESSCNLTDCLRTDNKSYKDYISLKNLSSDFSRYTSLFKSCYLVSPCNLKISTSDFKSELIENNVPYRTSQGKNSTIFKVPKIYTNEVKQIVLRLQSQSEQELDLTQSRGFHR